MYNLYGAKEKVGLGLIGIDRKEQMFKGEEWEKGEKRQVS